MAKLYAELTSDKGGRVASKGADSRLVFTIKQNNKVVGVIKAYPINGEVNGHRITWEGLDGDTRMIQNTDLLKL
jgi:hypothetical protein